MDNITLYGAHVSPYVRKTRLALAYKQLNYQHIFVVPFNDDQPEAFKKNSPLGKIPLLSVNDTWLPDSSVICAWLERAHPQPALLPDDPLLAARALWYEEYADTTITMAVGAHLFAEVILAPYVFKREPIQADIDNALAIEIPAIFDYLENELQSDYLLGTQFTLADLSVGSTFVTLQHCKHTYDATRWPKVAEYQQRLLTSELFSPIIAEETKLLAQMIQS